LTIPIRFFTEKLHKQPKNFTQSILQSPKQGKQIKFSKTHYVAIEIYTKQNPQDSSIPIRFLQKIFFRKQTQQWNLRPKNLTYPKTNSYLFGYPEKKPELQAFWLHRRRALTRCRSPQMVASPPHVSLKFSLILSISLGLSMEKKRKEREEGRAGEKEEKKKKRE
jgi:hypothetical protein